MEKDNQLFENIKKNKNKIIRTQREASLEEDELKDVFIPEHHPDDNQLCTVVKNILIAFSVLSVVPATVTFNIAPSKDIISFSLYVVFLFNILPVYFMFLSYKVSSRLSIKFFCIYHSPQVNKSSISLSEANSI